MNTDLKKTLEIVQQQVTEATEGYEWDEQAEFFGELATGHTDGMKFCLYRRIWRCRTTIINN